MFLTDVADCHARGPDRVQSGWNEPWEGPQAPILTWRTHQIILGTCWEDRLSTPSPSSLQEYIDTGTDVRSGRHPWDQLRKSFVIQMCRLRVREGQANNVLWLGVGECPGSSTRCALFIHSYHYSSKICYTCYVQGARPKNGDPYGDKASITLSSWRLQNNGLSTTITNPHHNPARYRQVLETKGTQPNNAPF